MKIILNQKTFTQMELEPTTLAFRVMFYTKWAIMFSTDGFIYSQLLSPHNLPTLTYVRVRTSCILYRLNATLKLKLFENNKCCKLHTNKQKFTVVFKK